MRTETPRGYWAWHVVLYRGDAEIDHGTIQEIAERRGVQKETIYHYTTPTGRSRAEKRRDRMHKGMIAVRVDDQGIDD